ncbi:MAG TPA: DegV family protein [Thermotogota bacterium]|nr:DegV family protein [Thermotogota bacterium]HPJ88963.1 DegV family protein [Thermotogota bacterium]HPR95899.1 DegV family protein [Thermotogota bacterium]
MEKVKILLDSISDIPLEWMEKMDVDVIPLHITWEKNRKTEDDCRDYDELERFWEELQTVEDLPKTSQPTPVEFLKLYEQYFSEGYDGVFVVTISSAMSGTYNSAVIAAKEYADKIVVIDSGLASVANALVGYRVHELLQSGKRFNELEPIIREDLTAGRFGAYFYVANFDFLRKGGRVSRFTGFVGTFLNLKVAIYINDEGILVPFGKSRGMKKAHKQLIEKAIECVKPGSKVRLAMVHSKNEAEAMELLEALKKVYEVTEWCLSPLGKAASSHVGPGTAGFGLERIE